MKRDIFPLLCLSRLILTLFGRPRPPSCPASASYSTLREPGLGFLRQTSHPDGIHSEQAVRMGAGTDACSTALG
ncbi:hypothetical protein CDEST_03171 [Colletotrichum destructivum]|uniref:Secreted protein n=1 Tax=Colletotrichum destructivum TaxID=34406 RepID=A0AAX4I4C1_9PEZI|nr:hypothetical protein CDEST_03171 [Colletotrichum destructivum]